MSYVRHDSFHIGDITHSMCATWLISHMWHDSFHIWGTRSIIYMWHDSFAQHMSYVRHDSSFLCMRDMTHFMSATWLISLCYTTNFTCATWSIVCMCQDSPHMHDVPCAATQCTTLHQTATHCNTLPHTATHCHTLRNTATHCNTLQHTATYGNRLQHTIFRHRECAAPLPCLISYVRHDSRCNTLQHTTTHCNTLFSPLHLYYMCSMPHFISATWPIVYVPYASFHMCDMTRAATHCNSFCMCNNRIALQHTATHYNTLQHTVLTSIRCWFMRQTPRLCRAST